MKPELKDLLKLDSLYVAGTAIAIWIPCLLQLSFGLANPYFITNTFLYGTAYLLLTRTVVCLMLLLKEMRERSETRS